MANENIITNIGNPNDPCEAPRPEFQSFAMAEGTQEPWWGIGSKVPADASTDEWLDIAKMNWRVQKRLVRMAESKENPSNFIPIPGYIAITRSDNNQVFQVASDRYTPVQNADILNFFRSYTDSGDMKIDTIGTLKDGAIVWALARVNGETEVRPGDKLRTYMLLANSHDGSINYSGRWTDERVVCKNTFSRAMRGSLASFAVKHSAKKETIRAKENAAKRAIDEVLGMHSQYVEQAKMLAETPVECDGQVVMEYLIRLTSPDLLTEVVEKQERLQVATKGPGLLDSIIEASMEQSRFSKVHKWSNDDLNRVGRSIIESIIESPSNQKDRNNWWDVFNGVTHYVDHEAGRNQDNRLTSAWFGQRAQLKIDALDLAVNYAQATR